MYGVELVVMVRRSVSDFTVELRVIVGLARVAVGMGGAKPTTKAVRVTVPLKFKTLVTLIVEKALSVGPRVSIIGLAETTKSGPITDTTITVELEKVPLVPVGLTR